MFARLPLSTLLLGALALGLMTEGCSEEPCALGATECPTSGLLRACVPGTDGNEWLVMACGPGESCIGAGGEVPVSGATTSTPVDTADAGGDASATPVNSPAETLTTTAVAACVGTCAVGQTECVNDATSRVCTAGGVWSVDPCSVGEACNATTGVCGVSSGSGAVDTCTPAEATCATDTVRKVCDVDGTAWVPVPCPLNSICNDGACVVDLDSSCDDGNRCLDNKTSLRCLGEGGGFEQVDCVGDTYCVGQQCQGSLCALGSTCGADSDSGNAQVITCVDGESFSYTECAAGDRCRPVGDHAFCEPIKCDTTVPVECGDPSDPSVDDEKFFTQCVFSSTSGVPEIVVGECLGDTICTSNAGIGQSPCRQECTDGEQMCDSAIGALDGISTCLDGQWGPVESCNPGVDARKICVLAENEDPAALAQYTCAEPICATTEAATCEGGQIRRCLPDGSLGAAEACEIGFCENTGVVQEDGLTQGTCNEDLACTDGEEMCISGNGIDSRYTVCVNGEWSREFSACPEGGACDDYEDDEELAKKLCGEGCIPNSRRCDPDSGDGKGVQTCSAANEWGTAADCTTGICDNVGSEDAVCVMDCVPGTLRCAGAAKLSSDSVKTGTAATQTCQADGSWADSVDCEGATTCRSSASGAFLGCIECIGPDAPGGNEDNEADSYCPDVNSVRSCGADNTWLDAVTCPTDTVCEGEPAQVCTSCTGPDGVTIDACTNTAYMAAPACGWCWIGGSSFLCTAANAAAQGVTDCTGIDTPGSNTASGTDWGGTAGCCENAQTTYGVFSGPWCLTHDAWGGEADCCDANQTGGGNQTVAECLPL